MQVVVHAQLQRIAMVLAARHGRGEHVALAQVARADALVDHMRLQRELHTLALALVLAAFAAEARLPLGAGRAH